MPSTPMIVLILSGTLSCGQCAKQEIEARSAAHTEAPAVLIVEDTSPLSQTARAEQFVITAARYDNAWTLPLVLDDTDVTYPATPAETSAQTEWLRLVLRHIAYQTSRSELAGPRVPASGSPSGVPRHMRKAPSGSLLGGVLHGSNSHGTPPNASSRDTSKTRRHDSYSQPNPR